MLDKAMYNSWESRMLLYIKAKKNGRMILESIENRPLVYPTVEVDSQIPKKKYTKLTEQEKLQDDCDFQVTNIVLQGLPPDVYSLVNHCQSAKMTVNTVSFKPKLINAAALLLTTARLGLVVLVFLPGDDPIACLNKAMAFMSTVVASRFPSTNNQLKTSSNPQNQATIQDGMVTLQQVQGRQGQSFAILETKGNATSSGGNNTAGQARVVKCYDCQGKGHMARQYTKPKRLRNSAWFKEKMLLVQAHVLGQVLNEDQLAFLVDPGIADCHDV
ncbi:hypothetical protein Tco_0925548 [Tanacetum coccineum]|uniref:CCHC-type domain-containing protein n=1 Tax=Tanacetum coccineum TaxID=301880 RepID=A0ABQ5DDB1_9ASTR